MVAAHGLLLIALMALGQAVPPPSLPPLEVRLLPDTPGTKPAHSRPAKPAALPQPEIPALSAPATSTSVADSPSPAESPVPPAPTFSRPAEAPPAEAPPVATPPRFDADYLRNPAPVYPPLSRRALEAGTVLLRVRVSAEGLALDVAIERGSGYERLDAAALAAVRLWRFVPARLGDNAVASSVLVPIHFSLTR